MSETTYFRYPPSEATQINFGSDRKIDFAKFALDGPIGNVGRDRISLKIPVKMVNATNVFKQFGKKTFKQAPPPPSNQFEAPPKLPLGGNVLRVVASAGDIGGRPLNPVNPDAPPMVVKDGQNPIPNTEGPPVARSVAQSANAPPPQPAAPPPATTAPTSGPATIPVAVAQMLQANPNLLNIISDDPMDIEEGFIDTAVKAGLVTKQQVAEAIRKMMGGGAPTAENMASQSVQPANPPPVVQSEAGPSTITGRDLQSLLIPESGMKLPPQDSNEPSPMSVDSASPPETPFQHIDSNLPVQEFRGTGQDTYMKTAKQIVQRPTRLGIAGTIADALKAEPAHAPITSIKPSDIPSVKRMAFSFNARGNYDYGAVETSRPDIVQKLSELKKQVLHYSKIEKFQNAAKDARAKAVQKAREAPPKVPVFMFKANAPHVVDQKKVAKAKKKQTEGRRSIKKSAIKKSTQSAKIEKLHKQEDSAREKLVKKKRMVMTNPRKLRRDDDDEGNTRKKNRSGGPSTTRPAQMSNSKKRLREDDEDVKRKR